MSPASHDAACAIAGLGITEMGKIYGRTATEFAAEAIALALDDAGLAKRDVDGLLINGNLSAEMNPNLQLALGFEDLTLLNVMNAYGSTPATMMQYAFAAIEQGQANVVVLLYADAPLQPATSAGASYATRQGLYGMGGVLNAHGFYGANPGYAMATQRHMSLYGTTSEQLGAIAVSQRQWAMHNERAQIRKPLTLEEHQALALHRRAAAPLRLLPRLQRRDRAHRHVGRAGPVAAPAAGLRARRRPGRAGDSQRTDRHPAPTPVPRASGQLGPRAGRRRAGRHRRARAVRLLHVHGARDAGGLRLLRQGRRRPVRRGRQARARRLAADQHRRRAAVVVLHVGLHAAVGGRDPGPRARAGSRQVDEHDLVLVSGNGGFLNYHSTMILSPHDA